MSAGRLNLGVRIGAISESRTNRVFTLARQLRLQGRDIINLAVGEPDFDTPQPVIDATRKALADRHTRYSPVAGMDGLRERLARQVENCGQENIIITNGAKQALYSLFQVLCSGGDEIIVPRPCWVSFCEQIKLAGATPVLVPTQDDHQLDLNALEGAITARTKAIVINTPNNPTGAVYPVDDLLVVAGMALRHRLYLVADEAYQAFVYDGAEHAAMARLADEARGVITIRSFSKHYNMTGFRLGFAAASREIITAMAKHQSHLCGNVCSFAQYGALAALEMDQTIVEQQKQILERRRRLALDLTADLFACVPPQGAFYLFPRVVDHLKPGESSEDFAMRLLDQCGVAVMPGEAFGGAGHIRICFGAHESEIEAAFERIRRAL